MTFKEELSYKADLDQVALEIQEYIEQIKEKLNIWYKRRTYTISLIKPHRTMVIGNCTSNNMSIFIPKNVAPNHYRQLFVNEFKDLGFTLDDMEFKTFEYNDFDSYDLILRW